MDILKAKRIQRNYNYFRLGVIITVALLLFYLTIK